MNNQELPERINEIGSKQFDNNWSTAKLAILKWQEEHCGHKQTNTRLLAALLKSSAGDILKLQEAIDLAILDWRDLLVGSGFSDDVNTHEKWLENFDR